MGAGVAGALPVLPLGFKARAQQQVKAPRIAFTSPTLPSYVNTVVGPLEFGPKLGLSFGEFNLLFFESHAVATQVVLAGRADVVGGSTASHLILRETGRDFKLFAPFVGTIDIVLAANEKVRGVEDLFKPNIRVAVDSPGGSGQLYLEALLDVLHAGRRVKDIPNPLILESSGLRATALANGDVDAAPIQSYQFLDANKALGGRLRVLAALDENVPLYLDQAFAAPSSWISQNLEAATRLAAAVLAANRALMRDFAYYVRSVRRYVRGGGPGEDVLRNLWERIRRYPFWALNDGLEYERVELMIDLAYKGGLLRRRLKAEEVVDRRPIEAALKLLGQASRSEVVGG